MLNATITSLHTNLAKQMSPIAFYHTNMQAKAQNFLVLSFAKWLTFFPLLKKTRVSIPDPKSTGSRFVLSVFIQVSTNTVFRGRKKAVTMQMRALLRNMSKFQDVEIPSKTKISTRNRRQPTFTLPYRCSYVQMRMAWRFFSCGCRRAWSHPRCMAWRLFICGCVQAWSHSRWYGLAPFQLRL